MDVFGHKPPYLAIALVSAAALAYEILLTRLFDLIQWHHFAHMVISLALLGFGASGAFLAFTARRLCDRFHAVFAANALLFALSAVACFRVVQGLPFNPLELLWDPVQPLWLALVYLLLAVPFFFAANALGLSFYAFSDRVASSYAFDLVGAGLGSLALVGALYLAAPERVLVGVAALGAGAGLAVLAPVVSRRLLLAAGALVLGAAMVVEVPLHISPYKGLSQALQTIGARLERRAFSPLGVLDVVANERVPVRYAPGLSLLSPALPSMQKAVFTDADDMSAITGYDGRPEGIAFLGYMTSALPYRLLTAPRVLVLGAGGGMAVLQAILHRARHVDAVELNPQLAAMVRGPYADFAGGLYQRSDVTLHLAEARGFVARGRKDYDLIQLALLDSLSGSAAGLHALNEGNLYTVEALRAYLGRLEAGGVLAITRWLKLPPRDGLKIFATAVTAMGGPSEAAARRLIWIRGNGTGTLLVGKGPFAADAIALARAFCEERGFDLNYAPGIQAAETNRYNRVQGAPFFKGAAALLGAGRDEYLRRYKFDIAPATDDRPYFANFFRWRTLPEIIRLKGQGGLALLDSGYLILALTLVQALAASALFIGLPAWYLRRRLGGRAGATLHWPAFGYFLGIGLAFLGVEIAFIQRFTLFLSHPIYAVVAVLSAFLVFAGLGSAYTGRLASYGRGGGQRTVYRVVAAIGLLALGYLWLLPLLFQWWMPLHQALRVFLGVTVIAPLAFCMGMPFPLGIRRLGDQARDLVPWAWAINGCASVVGAVLAALLAVHLGFTAVILAAVACYGLAAWAGRRLFRNDPPADGLRRGTGVLTLSIGGI